MTCDYVPTDSEQWFLDVLTGEVVIDSLFFQQVQLTSTEDYVIGCPEPVADTLVIEQTSWLFPYVVDLEYPQLYFENSSSSNSGYAFFGISFSQGYYDIVMSAEPEDQNQSVMQADSILVATQYAASFRCGFILNESELRQLVVFAKRLCSVCTASPLALRRMKKDTFEQPEK